MADVKELRIYSAEQITVPEDFPGILKNFTKEVVRNNPENIIGFAKSYFEQILVERGYFEKHARYKVELLPKNFYAYCEYEFADLYQWEGEIVEGLNVVRNKFSGVRKTVKVVPKDTIQGDANQQHQTRIELHKDLDHPCVLRLVESYEDLQNVYLVQEFFSPMTVSDLIIQSGPLKEMEAALIVKDLLSLIYYLHSNLIAHRDIKLENILYDPKQKARGAKICDYGLATKFSLDKPMTEMVGTAYSIAPEVVMGGYGAKCDEWSVGVCMYIMLTGNPPFDGESDMEILQNVKRGKYTLEGSEFEHLSEEAMDLLTKLMNSDMSERIDAEEALTHPWFQKFENPFAKYSNQIEIEKTLEALLKFNAGNKMRQAVNAFMIQHLMSEEDIDDAEIAFRQLDLDKDGNLTVEEVMNGCIYTFGPTFKYDEAQEVCEMGDFYGSGNVNFQSWILATVPRELVLEKQKIEAMFKIIDREEKKSLLPDKLYSAFGLNGEIEKEEWTQIIKKVDKHERGAIDIHEFKNLIEFIFQQ